MRQFKNIKPHDTAERRSAGGLRSPLGRLLAGLLLGLLPAVIVAQEVREVRRAIVVGDDGKIVEMRGDGDGDGETVRWFHDGEEVEDGENIFRFGFTHLPGGYLGVEMTELTDPLRDHFGVPRGAGVMVSSVEEGSPAETAGIRAADIITAVNGEDVSSGRDLSRSIRALEDGESASLELWRDGKLEQLSATVAQREHNVFKIRENGTFRFEGSGDDDADVSFFFNDMQNEAIEKVREFLGSDEWRTRLESIEGLDFDTLQERMKEVERQLREIEGRLHEIEPEEDGL